MAAALYTEWIIDVLRRQIAFYFQVDAPSAEAFGDSGKPRLPPTEAPPEAPPEWPIPPMPVPLERRQKTGLPEVAQLRAPIARLLRDICEDLDDSKGTKIADC